MSTITKELAKLFRKITNSEIDAEGNAHVVLSPADSLLINNARIAPASLEAEASGRNPVLAYADSYRNMANHGVESIPVWSVITDLERNIAPLFTAPPAPVSVPAAMEMDDDFDSAFEHGKAVGWNACRAAMLQGAGPVTIKANGGGSEKDEPPKRGWVVTHSGKDYFYREQGDAATHMNAAVESGIGVSLRSFIPEPVTTAYKLPGDFESFISWLTSGDGIPDWLINGDKLDDEKVSFLLKVYRAGSRDANGKKGEGIFVSKSSEMSVSGITIGESQCRNSPVIPDGWVACSERMPEKGRILALFGKRIKEVCENYVDEGYIGSDGEYYFFDWESGPRIDDCHPYDKAIVSHWMYWELPAAPKREDL